MACSGEHRLDSNSFDSKLCIDCFLDESPLAPPSSVKPADDDTYSGQRWGSIKRENVQAVSASLPGMGFMLDMDEHIIPSFLLFLCIKKVMES